MSLLPTSPPPPRRRRFVRPALILAVLGPGLIAANAGNDAGGIATYASAGSQFGYRTLFIGVLDHRRAGRGPGDVGARSARTAVAG